MGTIRRVHQFQDVVLLSDKGVSRTEGPSVWFADGSVANLSDMSVVNRGPGRVLFRILDTPQPGDEARREFSFPGVTRVTVGGGDFSLLVDEAETDAVELEIQGSPSFIDTIRTVSSYGHLLISTPE